MWVWIAIAAGLVVALIICAVAALRTWRQVKALRSALTAVKDQLTTYTDQMQVSAARSDRN
jgi:uncharacterized membrane-anchored protein YhcB (DUF1043 family)